MIADIALPIPVGKNFSYSVPDEIAPYIPLWSRVRVPFHQRDAVGVVAGLKEGDPTGLKPVIEPLDLFPLVNEELSALTKWASSYYLAPMGLVMKYALPPVRDVERYLVAQGTSPVALNKMIKRSGRPGLAELYSKGALTLKDSLSHNDFSPAGPEAPDRSAEMAGQIVLVDWLEKRLERYISDISAHLENNGSILFLLPDHYAAGAYFSQRMKEFYGDRVLWFGSGIPVRQRMETYFRARHDGGYIILGNKSLVFLPVRNLSLIIAERFDDEEYRNEESFKFNAVRTAVERARLSGIPVILGSAACSLEILHHARENGYALHFRAADNPSHLPATVRSRSSGELLDRLCADIEDAVLQRMNVAVYVPRKEYGSYLRCQACREDLLCEKCGSPLTYDRDSNNLVCSSCGTGHPYIDSCPFCGSHMIGFSRIGASFVFDHISRNAPGIRPALITGDSLKKELSILRKNDPAPQCLVGTQVLSKLYGHHCDRLFLVDWEELRKMSGFRSDEKTHQVLLNLIDALTPDEITCYSKQKKSVDVAAYLDPQQFCETELQKRKDAEFPPFDRMFIIDARAKTRPASDRALAKVKAVLSANGLDPFVFGTVPASKGPYHVWKTLLKGPENLLDKAFTDLYNIPGVEIEPDPPNF